MTANEVVEALAGSTSWQPKTIMTMLKRLVDKGALSYKKKGRAFIYYPLVKEGESVAAESRSFIQRVSSGALAPVLASFIEDADLSRKDIDELRKLLNKKLPK